MGKILSNSMAMMHLKKTGHTSLAKMSQEERQTKHPRALTVSAGGRRLSRY